MRGRFFSGGAPLIPHLGFPLIPSPSTSPSTPDVGLTSADTPPTMADASPLRRAHALSAQASLLLRPANARSQTLHEALDAYRQAADLFEQSASTDEGATRTLELLTVQHRKLARDLERRIGAGHAPPEAVAKPLDAVAGGAKPVQDTASTGGLTEKPSGEFPAPPA